jgi:hypothetical protein
MVHLNIWEGEMCNLETLLGQMATLVCLMALDKFLESMGVPLPKFDSPLLVWDICDGSEENFGKVLNLVAKEKK